MVRWPGQVEAGSISDSIVGPIDLYPTILEAAGLEKPKEHIVDGESIVPILKQTGKLKRQAYFTWFPHLVPAVSVRQGDWKLIRRFEPHPKYPETVELYNLKNDVGETRNLAGNMPKKVDEFQALIDVFVKETGALYPKSNPAYNPNAKPTASKPKPKRPTPEKFLQRRDTNKDGFITLKEYIGNPKGRNVPALTKNFNRRDANKDAKLTLEELKKTK